MRRRKMKMQQSRKHFVKHANKLHKANLPRTTHAIMRGGIRL